MKIGRVIAFAFVLAPSSAVAQATGARKDQSGPACASCAEWNAPQQPFRIYGNTYYVGTHGLAAILVTSSEGHVLIDGGLPESAANILENIQTLGFRVQDIKRILNSHDHYDHAGGIAALQRASGAQVEASAPSALVLRNGASQPDDPQYGSLPSFAPVSNVHVVADRETVRVGPLALTAHSTPGHTPGGTTWTWQSCEADRCLELVYADSQTPVAADNFSFTRNRTYPNVLQDFARSFDTLEHLRCDILITPHPGASTLWERLAARNAGDSSALIDPSACRRYAATAREQLAKRVAAERTKP